MRQNMDHHGLQGHAMMLTSQHDGVRCDFYLRPSKYGFAYVGGTSDFIWCFIAVWEVTAVDGEALAASHARDPQQG